MRKTREFQSVAAVQSAPAAPDFDPAQYLADLEPFDLSDAQKLELLTTLWSIMRSFVELGFQADVSDQLLSDAGLIPTKDELG